jgi:tRNA-specific 2-thiouridylase
VKAKVAVGLSGGVDSAVTAALLVEQGYEVIGVFLECWRAPGCRVDEDRRDAMDVARQLGIGFQVLDFKEVYRKKVVDYFYQEYEGGRTPNPDVMCNREIKFGMFYDWAMDNNFDVVATGHYARIHKLKSQNSKVKTTAINSKTKYRLMTGVDDKKDQSYFLYQLREEQLSHILFPLGEMTKGEVRRKALQLKLPVAKKPDSQGICFIGEVRVKDFLQELGMEEKQGSVYLKLKTQNSKLKTITDNSKYETENMVEIGTHEGAWFYTIGQRHGIEINNSIFKADELGFEPENLPPLYVIHKDVMKNQLVVGVRAMAMRQEFEVEKIHWVSKDFQFAIDDLRDLKVRIRHGGQMISADVKMQNEKGKMTNQSAKILLREKMFGVAPGQAVVFYDGEVVVGGGIITIK